MPKKLNLEKLAQAVGGTVVIATLYPGKFKLNAKFDRLLDYAELDKLAELPASELQALYMYASNKKEYGQSLAESVSKDALLALRKLYKKATK